MNLEPAPFETRSLTLKDQIINRILQLNPNFHTKGTLAALKDHALLTVLEITISTIETKDFGDMYFHAFEAGESHCAKNNKSKNTARMTMSHDAFNALDTHFNGLVPEQDMTQGGIYHWVCNYAGGRFFTETHFQ